jgi:recombination associated protein RdgC
MLSNAVVYKLSVPFSELIAHASFDESLGVEAKLEMALKSIPFAPCTAQEMKKVGFCHPFDADSENMTFVVGNFIAVGVKTEVKNIPKSHINNVLRERAKLLEADKGRPLSSKQKSALKDEITTGLLPHAIPSSHITTAYFDTENNRITVNASSASKAEDVLALLRKALGSFPALPHFNAHDVQSKLQSWGKGHELPEKVNLGHYIKFSCQSEEKAVATFNNVMICSDEVQANFEDKLCVQLQMVVQDGLTFTLKDSGQLSGLKLDKSILEQGGESQDAEDARAGYLLILLNAFNDVLARIDLPASEHSKAA